MLLLLTLTSYTSFCQTATKTVSLPSDSVVVLPRTLVTYMVQDLVRYDGLKEETMRKDESILMLTKQVNAKEVQLGSLRSRLSTCEATNQEYQMIDEANTRTIEILKHKSGKFKRQRNVFIYFSAALIAGLIVK